MIVCRGNLVFHPTTQPADGFQLLDHLDLPDAVEATSIFVPTAPEESDLGIEEGALIPEMSDFSDCKDGVGLLLPSDC